MKLTLPFMLALMATLAACSEAPERNIETRILCVWDSVELNLEPGALDHMPSLATWVFVEHASVGEKHASPSMSAAFASFLTGQSVEEHGLRSVHELGAARLAPDVQTRAQRLLGETRRLASVSRGHFAFEGLDRGIGTWMGPVFPSRVEVWDADQVWRAIVDPLDEALASDAPVFLVLHFSDLRGDGWRDTEPSRLQLEMGLARWRGAGGEIDAAFALEDAGLSLATRLSTFLMRRTGDPRREALQATYRFAALEKLDSVLGELRTLLAKHGRLGAARLELDVGPDPSAPYPAGQGLRVLASGEFSSLGTKLVLPGEEAKGMAPGQEIALPGRGLPFVLRLEHPQLFYLGVEGIAVGSGTLGDCDVPLLLARRSNRWPDQAIVGPLLDLQKEGGGRLRGKLAVEEGATVELLITTFPFAESWGDALQVEGGKLEPHPRQPGVMRVTGNGPLSFVLPPIPASSRLGLVLRLNGERVSGSRMRYLRRSYVSPDRLDLCFSAASWTQSALRARPEAGETAEAAPIQIQLLDAIALRSGLVLPSPQEQALLRGLHEDE